METSPAESKLATAKTILSTAASVAATLMLARSVAHDVLPHEFQDYFFFNFRKLLSRFSSRVTMVIDEFDGWVHNQMYESADIYLGTKISPSTHRFKVTKPENEANLQIKMEGHQEVIDTFQGVKFRWVLVIRVNETRSFHDPRGFGSVSSSESKSFEVSFPRKYKDLVLNSYLPSIVKEAKSMTQEKRTIKIHTLNCDHMYGGSSNLWAPVNLDHPATFDTLALDVGVKNMILEDLARFVRRREYYRKVGKAWKRGYLLYGPPGTGKSSLIAAMANKLNFDIYDLELTEIRTNSELRRLLVATANRSILVVEDIDCTVELQDRLAQARAPRPSQPPGYAPQPQVTLSGFLNFIDGLWSSCGDERIIIFTTNHKEKLDPALLRPGRMDVHVHMSYCTPCGFRILAFNYLGIEEHALFRKIEELIQATEVTPAEVAEQLMRSDDLEKVLGELIEFLESKKKEQEEAKAKRSDGEPEVSPVADTEDGESGEQADLVEDESFDDEEN